MMLQKLVAILSCMWRFTAIFPDASSPVQDTDGQPLVSSGQYRIKPAIPDRGGPLNLGTRNKGKACPKYVGQVERLDLEGNPVKFTSSSPTIKEGWDVKIAFQASTSCPESTGWILGDGEPTTGRKLIATGIQFGIESLFRIVKTNGLYHLVWCTLEETPTCATAIILEENEVRLLALDGPELPFVFEKVEKLTT